MLNGNILRSFFFFFEAIKREEFDISCYRILRGRFCVKLVLSTLLFAVLKQFFPNTNDILISLSFLFMKKKHLHSAHSSMNAVCS